MTRIFINGFVILITVLLSMPVSAQEDENGLAVEAQVTAKSFYMGQAFSYSILIDGSNKVLPPKITGLRGFHAKKIEERPLKSTEKPGFIIRYELIPVEAGQLIIPEINLQVNGKIFTTEEIKVDVKKPAEHPGLKLSLLVSQNEVYVGEPFLVTFIWESELPLYSLKAVDVKLPFYQSPAFRSIQPWNSPEGGAKDTIGLPVSNIRTICSHEILFRDNKRIEVLKFQKVVSARYSGEFTLDPASLLCSFIPPNARDSKSPNKKWKPNYPSYFNNNFFEETGNVKHVKYTAKSNSVKIKAKDLPVDGRPDDFFGIVGKCSVTAKADPVILEAGAPLHLTIRIADYDFPSVLQMPDFSKLSTFNRNFSIPKQKSSGEYDKTTKIYTQTLRPLRTDVASVPPVRIPYFDTQTGTYNVALSSTISLTVKPAGKVTAFDAMLSSGTNLKNRLLESPQGIRHNTVSIAVLSQSVQSPFILFLIAALLPPFLYVLFLMISANKRLYAQNPARAKAQNAYKKFNKNMAGKMKAVKDLENAVRAYFAEKVNMKEDAHTCEELIRHLSKVSNLSEGEISKLTKLYSSFDTNRFVSDPPSPEISELVDSAKSLVKELNGRIKNV
jgi:hypothetical protein